MSTSGHGSSVKESYQETGCYLRKDGGSTPRDVETRRVEHDNSLTDTWTMQKGYHETSPLEMEISRFRVPIGGVGVRS